jgi:DNA-binding HxlR family transcriptional regulator
VEYGLTELGRSMSEPVLAFGRWIQEHLAEIDAARDRFDRRAKTPPAASITGEE